MTINTAEKADCEYGCPSDKLFDENSTEAKKEFEVGGKGPRLIRVYNMPEGETASIEIEVCGQWFPWKCQGCECVLTSECCFKLVNMPGNYRICLSEGAIGEALITDTLIEDVAKFDLGGSDMGCGSGPSLADIKVLVQACIDAALAGLSDKYVTSISAKASPPAALGCHEAVMNDGTKFDFILNGANITVLDGDGNPTTIQACLDELKAQQATNTSDIADHEARIAANEACLATLKPQVSQIIADINGFSFTESADGSVHTITFAGNTFTADDSDSNSTFTTDGDGNVTLLLDGGQTLFLPAHMFVDQPDTTIGVVAGSTTVNDDGLVTQCLTSVYLTHPTIATGTAVTTVDDICWTIPFTGVQSVVDGGSNLVNNANVNNPVIRPLIEHGTNSNINAINRTFLTGETAPRPFDPAVAKNSLSSTKQIWCDASGQIRWQPSITKIASAGSPIFNKDWIADESPLFSATYTASITNTHECPMFVWAHFAVLDVLAGDFGGAWGTLLRVFINVNSAGNVSVLQNPNSHENQNSLTPGSITRENASRYNYRTLGVLAPGDTVSVGMTFDVAKFGTMAQDHASLIGQYAVGMLLIGSTAG